MVLSDMEIIETFQFIDTLRDMSPNEEYQKAKKHFPAGYETFKALREIVINNLKNK